MTVAEIVGVRRMQGVSLALLLVSCLVISGSNAAVLSVDDTVFGADALTRDTAQNLDFLDLNLTVGRHYNDVLTQFGSGGDFEGFRYATAQEAVNLINNIGFSPFITVGSTFTGNTGTDQFANFEALLGVTRAGSTASIEGMTGTLLDPGSSLRVEIFDRATNDIILTRYGIPVTFVNPFIGSWLVKDSPAPAPASLLVFLTGAVLLASRRFNA